MKKLITIPFIFLGFISSGQSIVGINKEHLILSEPELSSDPYKMKSKRITLTTGVALEYVEQGKPDGIPVIFLHGITDSWHSFETVLPSLPDHIHAFALSQRGHGNSERPADGYSPKHFAADVAAFVKQKQLGKAIIVGHSMGGVIAQQFVLDYPQMTEALVIACSDAAIGKNPGMPEFYQEVMKMKGVPERNFMVGFQKATLVKEIDSVYFNVLIDENLKVPISVFQAAMQGLVNADYTNQLKKVNQPTLIFWGNKDAFFLREGQEALVNSIKGSKWIVYEDTGHALHWEQPTRFSKDIVDFINTRITKTR